METFQCFWHRDGPIEARRLPEDERRRDQCSAPRSETMDGSLWPADKAEMPLPRSVCSLIYEGKWRSFRAKIAPTIFEELLHLLFQIGRKYFGGIYIFRMERRS